MSADEFKNLEQSATRQCLHAIERISKTRCTTGEQVCQDVLSIARSLMIIEQYVMWESDVIQARYKNLVNDLGDAMTNNESTVDLQVLAERVGNTLQKVLKRTQPFQLLSEEEKTLYDKELEDCTKRLATIQSQLLNNQTDISKLQPFFSEANHLDNLICNAGAQLRKSPVNGKVVKRIFPILQNRILQLEEKISGCTWWNAIIDTLVSMFDKDHVPQCTRRRQQRRGSRSAA